MSREKVVFRALNSTYYATVQGEWVSLSMPDVIDNKREVDFIDPAGSKLSGQLLDTGAPHVVIPSTQIDSVDVETLGRYICHHPELPTDGTNVNFFCSRGSDRIALRTYERGVEAETLACGTGAVAAAVSAVIRLGLTTPITVDVRSGESLIVDFVMNGDRATHVILTGTARFLFSGFVVYDTVNGIIRDVGDLPPTHRS
jgi:diaminopimelate epimerase